MTSRLSQTAFVQPRLAIREGIKLYKAYRERANWNHLVIHRPQYATTPDRFAVPVICGPMKARLKRPSDVTILLVHNRDRESKMEKSLRYVGIDDFVLLTPRIRGPWRNSIKIPTILDYLRSGACTTEFILYCDSDDAFLRDDPAKAVTFLSEYGCDLLFSVERDSYGYECMPDVKAWADRNAHESGCSGLYINSGVYIGRTTAIRQLFEEATHFVTDSDLSRSEYVAAVRNGTLSDKVPDYPKGVGTDQVVFRWLHPQFYPAMKCDYAGKLALRH